MKKRTTKPNILKIVRPSQSIMFWIQESGLKDITVSILNLHMHKGKKIVECAVILNKGMHHVELIKIMNEMMEHAVRKMDNITPRKVYQGMFEKTSNKGYMKVVKRMQK